MAAVLSKRSNRTNQHEKRNRRNEVKTATIVDQAYARKAQATHPARVVNNSIEQGKREMGPHILSTRLTTWVVD